MIRGVTTNPTIRPASFASWGDNIVVKITVHGPEGELENMETMHELETRRRERHRRGAGLVARPGVPRAPRRDGAPPGDARAFKDGDYARVSQKRDPGWSRVDARVLATGSIRQGDPVRLLDEAEAGEVTATAR